MQLKLFTIIIIIIIIYPIIGRFVGAPQMISQPVSSIVPCSPLPPWTWRTPGLSFPDVVFPPLLLSALPSFTVPCKMVLDKPDERETCQYHCSLCLFTMAMRSSCGPIKEPSAAVRERDGLAALINRLCPEKNIMKNIKTASLGDTRNGSKDVPTLTIGSP